MILSALSPRSLSNLDISSRLNGALPQSKRMRIWPSDGVSICISRWSSTLRPCGLPSLPSVTATVKPNAAKLTLFFHNQTATAFAPFSAKSHHTFSSCSYSCSFVSMLGSSTMQPPRCIDSREMAQASAVLRSKSGQRRTGINACEVALGE